MARGRTETKYRRRGRFGLLYKLLSLIIIIGAVAGGVVLFFQVEDIQVEGNERYSAELIISAAGVGQNDNLLLLTSPKLSGRIAAKVMTVYPYVEEVTVKPEFPSTLKLVIKECTPAVVMAVNENWWLIAPNGRVLDSVDAASAQQYPQAAGFDLLDPQLGQKAQVAGTDTVRLNSMLGLLSALEEKGMLDKLGWVDMSSATEIRFLYDGRVTVEVLMNADYPRKMEILNAILENDEVGPYARGVADLKSDRCYFRPN